MKVSALGAVGVTALAVLSSSLMTRRAYAFGGLLSSQTARVDVTAEQLLFVGNPDSTATAIVGLEYAGPAKKFVWVIPVRGKPKVRLSSNAVFQRLDAATAPEYRLEVAVKGACKEHDDSPSSPGAPPSATGMLGATGASTAPPASVVTLEQGVVGPYEYVELRVGADATDPTAAAAAWLTKNGYDSTSLDGKVLTPYWKGGFDLLAFRLAKDKDAGDIRPISLTFESALPSIPILPTSVAAREGVRVKVWVLGPSQAVPDNYESLVLDEARVDWVNSEKHAAGTLPAGGAGPFGPHVSAPNDYDALVLDAAREAGGRGFVTELAAPASQYRQALWSPLDEQHFAAISTQRYTDGIDAVRAANASFGGWDGWTDAVRGATALPRDVTVDLFVKNPDEYRGRAKVDATRFFRLLREKVIQPVTDAAALLYEAPYLTRLYTILRPEDMTVDPRFAYNGELAQVSSTHIAKELVQCNPAVNQRDAEWQIELPHGGNIRGKGEVWPVAAGSLPANLKRVQLSTSGSGTVKKDNTEEIEKKLFALAGGSESGIEMLHPPQNGVLIGTTQTVRPHGPVSPTPLPTKPATHGKCSVSRPFSSQSSVIPTWLSLAAVSCALRRRRGQRPGVDIERK